MRKKICFTLLWLSFFQLMETVSFDEQAINFIQALDQLRSAALTFEKKYTNIPKLSCVVCKNEITFGAIIGALIGSGLKIMTEGGNFEKLTELSTQMIEIFQQKTHNELGPFMVSAANELSLTCQSCQAINWKLTEN